MGALMEHPGPKPNQSYYPPGMLGALGYELDLKRWSAEYWRWRAEVFEHACRETSAAGNSVRDIFKIMDKAFKAIRDHENDT